MGSILGCAVSSKECWLDEHGRWMTDGGFPMQLHAIASLFDRMDLLVVGVERRQGGSHLPQHARIVPLPRPQGQDARRKLSLIVRAWEYLPTIFRHVRAAEVLYIPLPGDLPLIAMVIGLLLRKRMIVRYGGSWETTSQTTVMEKLTRQLVRAFAGGNNVMFAAGAGDTPPAPRMSWIFSTSLTRAELESIRPDLHRGIGHPPRLVYAGRLSVEKGLDRLIRAMARLGTELPGGSPSLAIAGDGPERSKLKALVTKLGCADRVTFCGQLTRDELSSLFMSSDLCVQPSLTEGYSKAWLDAMAHGLPVIASQVGAAKEVVGANGDRGWLVPPGDIDALILTLKSALTGNTDWMQMRQRCRRFVEGRTIEEWGRAIGMACTRQWGWSVDERGRVRPLPEQAGAYANA